MKVIKGKHEDIVTFEISMYLDDKTVTIAFWKWYLIIGQM